MQVQDSSFAAYRVLAAAAFGAIVLIAVTLPLLALQVDHLELGRELKSVTASIAQTRELLLERLGAASNRDSALLHMNANFDAAWIRDTFTNPYEKDLGSRLFGVFDPQGNILLAAEAGEPVAAGRTAAFRQAVLSLLSRMRAAETQRDAASRAGRPAASGWNLGTASVWIEGRPYLLHASEVGGSTGTPRQAGMHAPIVVFATDLYTKVLPGLNARVLLRQASFSRPGAAACVVCVTLPDSAGRASVLLSWVPDRPGSRMLSLAAMPLLLGVGFLLVAIVFTYRQGLAATRGLMASQTRAHYLATHDTLTGLPNRAFLTDRIVLALTGKIENSGAVAVLLLDLDHFKAVNDSGGHQCGDELLVAVARRLSEACGAAALCVRLGGDEFVILAQDCDEAAACVLAAKILAVVSAPVRLTSTEIRTTASIGISIGRRGGARQSSDEAGDLLRQADVALYQAKENGRGIFRVFDPAMDERARQIRDLERELRQALQQGSIGLAYQPQVNGKRLVGVEALARWTHPDLGPIAPSVFVKLAEECGLIEALGAHVLRRAFADSRAWPGLKVAVNVSARQLRLPGFLPLLADLVAAERVDPAMFELEITEGLLLVEDAWTLDVLAGIKAMGFGLALDDFGTGYSSLSYLRRFPIDTIKIDQSFTASLTAGSETERVVRAILGLAEALSLGVVAEGVETEEQRRCLTEMGCTIVQGYLTGRPVSAAQVGAKMHGYDSLQHWAELATGVKMLASTS